MYANNKCHYEVKKALMKLFFYCKMKSPEYEYLKIKLTYFLYIDAGFTNYKFYPTLQDF